VTAPTVDVRNVYCKHGDIHDFCAYSLEQELFSEADDFELFFGGAAGPGKTILLLNEGLRQIEIPGYQAIFFRRTFDELSDAIEMSHATFPQHGGKFISRPPTWTFPVRQRSAHPNILRSRTDRGTRYFLRYCARDTDKLKHLGRAYAYIAWDELTMYPNDSVYTYLFLRCRPLWQGQKVRCYIRAASNPGGPGHSWVKQRFIDGRVPFQSYEQVVEDEVTGQKYSYRRKFIPATLDSNDKIDPMYIIALLSYPDPELRRAMRHGDWDIAAGVMFSELRERLHVEPTRDPLSLTRKEIAIDYAYNGFCAIGWFEVTSGMEGVPHHVQYRELVLTETPPELIAQMILERTPRHERIQKVTIDTNAWVSLKGDPSPVEQMTPAFKVRAAELDEFGNAFGGWQVRGAHKGPGSRARGWTLMHTYFYPRRRGGALLKIMKEKCPVTWRQLTGLARGIEPHDIEDIEPHQTDDAADMVRYYLQGRPRPADPTPDEILMTDLDLDKASIDLASYEYAQIERLRRVGFPAIKDTPLKQRPIKKPLTRRTRPWK